MNALFIANVDLKENEGIYKKIFAQGSAFRKAVGRGWLILKHGKGSRVYDYQKEIFENQDSKVLDSAAKLIEKQKIGCIYVRHMIPSVKLVRFLHECRAKNIRIFYEIPTYPYYAEQFRTAKKKHRAVVKITLDTIFWPAIYRNIDHLVTIRSSTKVHMYSKMVEITNGAQTSNVASKDWTARRNDEFSMVAVGTIYGYHGYDRILKGLQNCGESVHGIPVRMHFVGKSSTMDELAETVRSMGLKNVVFHGIKTTEELNELYRDFDIGLGCLALYRRNADIDTTIKIVEYYCRGVPVVTSGISPMDAIIPDVTIRVPNNDDAIDVEQIYDQYKKIPEATLQDLSVKAREILDWDCIIRNLYKKTMHQ